MRGKENFLKEAFPSPAPPFCLRRPKKLFEKSFSGLFKNFYRRGIKVCFCPCARPINRSRGYLGTTTPNSFLFLFYPRKGSGKLGFIGISFQRVIAEKTCKQVSRSFANVYEQNRGAYATKGSTKDFCRSQRLRRCPPYGRVRLRNCHAWRFLRSG